MKHRSPNENNFFKPKNLKDLDVLLTHQKSYYERFSSLSLTIKETRPIGFPMSEELIIREKKTRVKIVGEQNLFLNSISI